MMDLPGKHITKIDKLAETLRQDIHSRSLNVGDHYLTAAEASQMLGVSQVMANRAMNVLAGRRLLTRHRRRGTFIGPAFQSAAPPTALRVIHIIKGLSQNKKIWTPVIGDCLQGLHTVFPDFQVQSNILPLRNPSEMVRQIFNQHTANGSLAGVVLVSCPREEQELVQDLLCKHRLQAVSFGSVYPNITKIPSIDQNQFEAGRLMANYLLDRGHRRIILLTREHWLLGDNLLADGVNQALADAGMSYGTLSTRSIPEDVALIKTELSRVLSLDKRPTGVVCRGALFAKVTADVARARSMRVPQDLDIIFNANDRHFSKELGLPRACAKQSSREQLILVAKTLEKLLAGKIIENNNIILPVELVEPEK